jgi:hypothetical protein
MSRGYRRIFAGSDENIEIVFTGNEKSNLNHG